MAVHSVTDDAISVDNIPACVHGSGPRRIPSAAGGNAAFDKSESIE
jgi:hypothetical protein